MMNNLALLKEALGAPTDQQLFDTTWGKAVDPSQLVKLGETMGTPSIREMRKRYNTLLGPNASQKSFDQLYSKSVQKYIMSTKDGTMAGVATAIPIIFDQEIFNILQGATPFLDLIPKRGYVGTRLRLNNISARDNSVGFVSEAESADITGQSNGDFTIAPVEAEMKIHVDIVNTTEFGQRGSEHYMDLHGTGLAQRTLQYLLQQEQALLYGNPTKAGLEGDAYSISGYTGLAKSCEDAGTAINKAAVSSDVVGDVKKVISDMLQSGNAINVADLQIWCSHTMYNILEDEITDFGRIELDKNAVNYGFGQIIISGVPIYRGQAIREYTFGIAGPSTETEGSPGDIFIVNTSSAAMWYLAPLSMINLGAVGLAQRQAIFEFSTFADRSDGLFNRYLYNYPTG